MERDAIEVLYVESESALAETVAAVLDRAGLAVTTATSVATGLEHLEGERVDCVVSEYDLPDGDGIAFCEAVRAADQSVPFVLYTASGSERIASAAFSAGVTEYLRRGDAGHDQLVATIREVVTEDSATQAGRRADERLRELTEQTDDVLWVVTGDWTEVLFVNAAVEEVFGCSPATLADQPAQFLRVAHPDDRPKVRRGMERLSAGHAVDIEYRVERGDGPRWVWLRAEPVGEAVDTIVGLVRDITARKQREHQLRQTTLRLQALFDGSPDMIAVHDSEGTVLDPNPQLCEATGYDESELAGRKLWDLAPDVDPRHATARWERMAPGDSRRTDGRYRRADGTTFPVETHVRRLSLNGDDRFVAVSRDITERKARERELRGQNERLDEFASIVSHDLRNPLNVATLRLGLAREETDSEHLETVADALDRMDGLIEDLLTLARDGDGSPELRRVALDRVCAACWGVIETGDARLVTDTDRSVRADEGRLRQLLENLFRNSVEHSSTSADSQARRAGDAQDTTGQDGAHTGAEARDAAGSGSEGQQATVERESEPPVSAGTSQPPSWTDESGVTVTVGTLADGFYVEDDGPGIPPGRRNRVFDSGYTSAEGGTGLGLNIVKRIVDAHGWEIVVTEGSDGGARFEITGVEFA
jgi:PAS domain S-box-containing protein